MDNIDKIIMDLDRAGGKYKDLSKDDPAKEKVLGIAQSFFNLAKVFIKAKNYHKALENSLKSLAIKERVLYEDDELLAKNYYQLGKIYTHLNDRAQAAHYLAKAKEIMQKINHPHDVKLAGNIENLYSIVSQMD